MSGGRLLLGATPKFRDDTWSSILQHGLLHLMFGITTAFVAKQAERRL